MKTSAKIKKWLLTAWRALLVLMIIMSFSMLIESGQWIWAIVFLLFAVLAVWPSR